MRRQPTKCHSLSYSERDILYQGRPIPQSHHQKQSKTKQTPLPKSDTSVLLRLDNQPLTWAREAKVAAKEMKKWKGKRASSPVSRGSPGRPTLPPPNIIRVQLPHFHAAASGLIQRTPFLGRLLGIHVLMFCLLTCFMRQEPGLSHLPLEACSWPRVAQNTPQWTHRWEAIGECLGEDKFYSDALSGLLAETFSTQGNPVQEPTVTWTQVSD